MSDALVSPAVAAVAAAAAVVLVAVGVRKVSRSNNERNMIPIMGVMGAFVFAAQMLNFAVPGTGSSGHIVGGILLAAVLGPWAAYLTLTSVLLIQALVFADGGLMALGCNIFNMGAMACLVAYPLVFRPIVRKGARIGRIMLASVLASTLGLVLGASAVTFETELSGITALPTIGFLGFMVPIHIVIGILEGVATGAVLSFVWRAKPDLIEAAADANPGGRSLNRVLAVILLSALLAGGALSLAASSDPDGLEWSIERVAGTAELEAPATEAHEIAAKVQDSTALMPDYERTSLAGIVGCGVIVLAAAGVATLRRSRRRR